LGLAGLVLHRSPEPPRLSIFLIPVPVAFGLAWLRYYRNAPKVFDSMPDRRGRSGCAAGKRCSSASTRPGAEIEP